MRPHARLFLEAAARLFEAGTLEKAENNKDVCPSVMLSDRAHHSVGLDGPCWNAACRVSRPKPRKSVQFRNWEVTERRGKREWEMTILECFGCEDATSKSECGPCALRSSTGIG